MKIVIILVLVILLLGGGVIGASLVAPDLVRPILEPIGLMEPADPNAEPEPEVYETAKFPMDIMSIPIIENDAPAAFLILEMTLLVKKGDGQVLVQRNIPRIKDAIIRYILSLSAIDDRPALTNLDFLKDRLITVINRVIGDDVVVGILFVNVFERPL